jgi:hypothetical protein
MAKEQNDFRAETWSPTGQIAPLGMPTYQLENYPYDYIGQ